MFEADFTLNYPVNPGTWTIRVDGFVSRINIFTMFKLLLNESEIFY